MTRIGVGGLGWRGDAKVERGQVARDLASNPRGAVALLAPAVAQVVLVVERIEVFVWVEVGRLLVKRARTREGDGE